MLNSEERTERARLTREERRTWLVSASSFTGGVAGLLAILTVVFYGGALAEKVQSLERRVQVIETTGSAVVQRHVDEDNARVADIRRRQDNQETVLADVARLKADVAAISAKLDFLIQARTTAGK